MKRLTLILAVLLSVSLHAEEAGFKSLFNGKDLSGWRGDPKLWSVQDGAITGVTDENDPLPFNKFLIWDGGKLKDFELRATFRLTGNNNSGIQYRSAELKDVGEYSVGGYQADIHPKPENNGMLYDERGRGIIATSGQKVIIDKDGGKWLVGKTDGPFETNLEEWNEYVIIANGNHLIHKINGKVTAEIIDHQESERELEGILALQVHRGPSMRVQYKSISLKVLEGGKILTPEEAPIPEGAGQVGKPKPRLRQQLAKAEMKKILAEETKPEAPAEKKEMKAEAKADAPKVEEKKEPAKPSGADGVPRWIWSEEVQDEQVVYFRKHITGVNNRTGAARLYASCDNEMMIYVNGNRVRGGSAWDKPVFNDILTHLNKERGAKNVIAIRAKNSGGAAGFVAKLILDSDKDPIEFVTDETWKVSSTGGKGWTTADFDDKEWGKPAHVIAKIGSGPWVPAITAESLTAVVELVEPEATPVKSMNIKPGFKVELLHTVPAEEQGSWVSMTVDDKGRLITSDQYGGLYRVTPPALGKKGPTKVEAIEVDMGHAQGLLYAFDSLYVVVNANERGGRGLYRVTDSNKDDKFDKVELLKKFEEQGSEHGPHAVLLTPDGKNLNVVCGNQTALPEYSKTLVPPFWGEDQLLPRIYGRGFMKGVEAPRGWIAQCDPDGKNFVIMATGFRNEYDAAYNHHGELFTYDADMEWDLNTPWYRPTRVNQVVSGAEFGWRNGSAKWPAYYPDSLPAVVDIGPGSPTGVTFGYGAKFPAKYQNAFFISDWSYGKLYAVHLNPKGSSYEGTFEEFITGAPLPLTDIVVNPKDKAMYFLIGGRKVQSGLYRVTYTGKESTEPAPVTTAGAKDRAIRRELEKFHGVKDPGAVSTAWPFLGHQDRFIRFAARVAIEHQDPATWQNAALREGNDRKALAALLALVRVGDKSLQPSVLAALDRIIWNPLSYEEKLELVRVYSLAFIRMGEPDARARLSVGARFNSLYPSPDGVELNQEMCQLLVYLQHPETAAKSVPMMLASPSQEEQIHFAKSLRLLRTGWTMGLRQDYFNWFPKAAGYRGGASFSKFVESIKNDAVAGLDKEQLAELKPVIDKQAEQQTPAGVMAELSKIAERGFYKEWKMEDLASSAQASLTGRNFQRGRTMFGAAACFSCHRFDGQGGIVGPDLTGAAGRFSAHDLLVSIVEPNKEISDQYGAIVVTKVDGSTVTGRIANLSGDRISIITDMFDPGQMESVDRKQVKSIEPSKLSMMPAGLVNMLKEDEILDLVAYVLSGGKQNNPMFR